MDGRHLSVWRDVTTAHQHVTPHVPVPDKDFVLLQRTRFRCIFHGCNTQTPAAPHTKTVKSVPMGFERFQKRGRINLGQQILTT